ncbi:M15 family metallopeptidase [Stenotrophomonas mori]|uniref:D-alanyl-D-alanine dipeptidase n=1 Tax=Stenotrophomonas mori TaxID=2871096 RepID=A0ABT0SJK5_9GAMM|nr:M15 family metallopeptidase [Stenotrophomonas mori]MCL7715493.1 M15 family metallopeptidase [Stenotrophomonas mori]
MSIPRCLGLSLLSACAATAAAAPAVSPATTPAEAGMLDVATLAPGFSLDMRYAGSDNFTGRPVPGYDAPRCYLLAPVAQALARVQRSLQAQGHALRLYDCYRPVRAVQSFVVWAHDPADQQAKARYYPNVDKDRLLDGYIAEHSGHSRGATVDLGLLDCRSGTCEEVDMGTGFDRFDPLAHTDNPDISAAQRDSRRQLLDAMEAEGFANYPMEWWHYTFQPEPTPGTAYDFPVR